MKLVTTRMMIVLVTLIGLSCGATFAQDNQVSLTACGEAQVIAQSSDAEKVELEFTSNESMAKCFNDFNSQLSDAGWQRIKGDNNIYKNDFYRIVYENNGVKAMLVLRQTETTYKAVFDL